MRTHGYVEGFSDESVPCNECFGGLLRIHRQSYLFWTGKELIHIPNFPARCCDLCGWRDYDPRAVYRFQMIYGRPIDGGAPRLGSGGDELPGPLRQAPD